MDGDGKKDLISGSNRGWLYFFKNLGDGRFAPNQCLKMEDGKNIYLPRGSNNTCAAADLNGDGIVDLIVSTNEGLSFLTGRGPLVFADPQPILCEGEAIPVNHPGVHLADWDLDGEWELLLGNGKGGVALYEFEGGVPNRVKPPTVLIPDREGEGVPTDRCCSAAKPTVTDWNGDGKPDLLVGDTFSIELPSTLKTDLTPEEKRESEALIARKQELYGTWSEIMKRFRKEALQATGIEENDASGYNIWILGDEVDRRRKVSPEYQEIWQMIREAEETLVRKGYQAGPSRIKQGRVWVYLRREMPPGPLKAE